MLPVTSEQIVLKNTFLTVECIANGSLCSVNTRRSKSSDGLYCQRASTSCETLDGFRAHAIEDQMHRLNRLHCLEHQDCLSHFNNQLLYEAAHTDRNSHLSQKEHDQAWTPSQESHCTASLSETSKLALAGACLYDQAHCTKEQDSKALPCKPHVGGLSPDLSVPAESQSCKPSKVQSEFTTAMILNIPYHYTQDQLVWILADLGFTGMCYDFLYLPSSKGNRSNVGYVFVNFKEAHSVRALKKALRKYRFDDLHGAPCKPPNLSAATCQGFMNNLVRFSQVPIAERTRGSPLIEVEAGVHRLLYEVM